MSKRPYNDAHVFLSAGAGLWTTPNDQIKFYRMLMSLCLGGLRIAASARASKGVKLRVRFGESVSETMSELGERGRPVGHAQVRVAFPPARSRNGVSSRGWDYAVRCELLAGDIVRTLVERCVFSPNSMMSEEDDNQLVVCAFARSELPKELNAGQKVRFVITPRTCWGKEGRPISVESAPKGK